MDDIYNDIINGAGEDLSSLLRNFLSQNDVDEKDLFKASYVIDAAIKDKKKDDSIKRCPFYVCDMAFDMILSGCTDINEAVRWALASYNQDKTSDKCFLLEHWEASKYQRVSYCKTVIDNNEEHPNIQYLKQRGIYDRNSYTRNRSALSMLRQAKKDMEKYAYILSVEMENERLLDENLAQQVEQIEMMKREGYFNEAERKKRIILAYKKRGKIQKKVVEDTGISIATVKRYWNADKEE